MDLLIKNALVVDGSGKAGYQGNVAIQGDKLVLPQGEVQAEQVVDAQGLVLAPGFIDIHSHTTLNSLLESKGGSKIAQGITTDITGNCGIFPHPYSPQGDLDIDDMDWSPEGYKKYLAEFGDPRMSMNLGLLIGHGSIRAAAMGYDDRQPTADELEKMKEYVAIGMEHGAVGISTGLIYPPGVFAQIDELVELCKVVAKYGGVHATHMRNEGNRMLESIDEVLEISRRSGVSLQVSHLKAAGRSNWGKVAQAVQKLEQARKEGMDVNYDFYPYTASATGLSSQLPGWVHEGGWQKVAERLNDPTTRAKITAQVKSNIESSVDWTSIIIASVKSEANQPLAGKNLEQIGAIRDRHPVEVLVDLLLEEDGDVAMVKFGMDEKDVEVAAAGSIGMVGTDGGALPLESKTGQPHPRSYGSFPRVLRKYWRERELLSLEQAVHKMTGGPAQKLRLNQRGLIKEGYFADLVLFDPERVGDAATFDDPRQAAHGIDSVYVNGKKVYQEGEFLDPQSGMLVTR